MAQDSCVDCNTMISEVIYYGQLQVYTTVSCAALMVYDHLHTLPMEVTYVWLSRRLTIVNVLYYISKYGIFFSAIDLYIRSLTPDNAPPSQWPNWVLGLFNRSITVQECQYTGYIYATSTVLTLWAGEAVLGIRIWAIWGKKRSLTIALPIIFCALFITNLVFVINYIGSMEYGQSPAPQYISCFVTKANNGILYVDLVCIPAWVALMFLLLTTSAYLAYKSGGNTWFVRTIYQEGIIYYIYLLLLHGGNIVISSKTPPGIASVLTTPVGFLHVALASRVILHIRKQVHMRLGQDSDEAT